MSPVAARRQQDHGDHVEPDQRHSATIPTRADPRCQPRTSPSNNYTLTAIMQPERLAIGVGQCLVGRSCRAGRCSRRAKRLGPNAFGCRLRRGRSGPDRFALARRRRGSRYPCCRHRAPPRFRAPTTSYRQRRPSPCCNQCPGMSAASRPAPLSRRTHWTPARRSLWSADGAIGLVPVFEYDGETPGSAEASPTTGVLIWSVYSPPGVSRAPSTDLGGSRVRLACSAVRSAAEAPTSSTAAAPMTRGHW